jgi:Tubulin binding cofactor A
MPAPSKLVVATNSVKRLVSEEASYHRELQEQKKRVGLLQQNPDGGENAEYIVKQEVGPLLSRNITVLLLTLISCKLLQRQRR